MLPEDLIPAEHPQPPRKPPQRTGKSLYVYLDPSLRNALDALADRTRRSVTPELAMALEEHLKEAGLWPPPASEED
jgi:hypothetical protein